LRGDLIVHGEGGCRKDAEVSRTQCHNGCKGGKDMRHEIHVLLMLKNEFVSAS